LLVPNAQMIPILIPVLHQKGDFFLSPSPRDTGRDDDFSQEAGIPEKTTPFGEPRVRRRKFPRCKFDGNESKL
ncbi:hypothetical protein A2U01_0057864, partial [Trifolium medium]|nr:hypothetical protein [Trifolium medium]